MTKAELIKLISKKAQVSQVEASRIFDATLEVMSNTLSQGETITIKSFGVFIPKAYKARMGRNPQNGDDHVISARKTVNFRPTKQLKEVMNY